MDSNINDKVIEAMQKLNFANKYDFLEFLKKYSLLNDLENEQKIMDILDEICNPEVIKRLKVYCRKRESKLKEKKGARI